MARSVRRAKRIHRRIVGHVTCSGESCGRQRAGRRPRPDGTARARPPGPDLPRRALAAADQRTIHTMDAKRTVVSKVRIANGKFVEVGDAASAVRRLHRHDRSPRPHGHPRDDRQPLPRAAGGQPSGLRDPHDRDRLLDRRGAGASSASARRACPRGRSSPPSAGCSRGSSPRTGCRRWPSWTPPRRAIPSTSTPRSTARRSRTRSARRFFESKGVHGVGQRPHRAERAVVGRAGRAARELDAGRHQADDAAGVRLLQQRRPDHRALGARLAGPRTGAVLRLGRAAPDAGAEAGGPADAAAAALLQHRPARGRQAGQPRAARRARQPVGRTSATTW